ncbi:MAG TPA: hypothetical protein VIJ12_10810 [Candidatus Baltobacteraceae bacterium]
MRSLRAAACGLALVGVLGGCGSATSGMGFTVPSGYQSKFNLFGQEAWVRGNSSKPELIMLISVPNKTFNTVNFEQNFNINSSGAMKNTKFTQRKDIVICNGQKAVLLKGTGTSTKSDAKAVKTTTAEDMDMLVTGWGKTTYVAMYVRPHTGAPDAASEAALKTLCPKAS